MTQEPNEDIKHLVCLANEILYTTKYNYVIEKDFAGVTGFGDTNATVNVASFGGPYGSCSSLPKLFDDLIIATF